MLCIFDKFVLFLFEYLEFWVVDVCVIEDVELRVMRLGFVMFFLFNILSLLIVESDFDWGRVFIMGVFDILFRRLFLIFFVEIVVVVKGVIRGVVWLFNFFMSFYVLIVFVLLGFGVFFVFFGFRGYLVLILFFFSCFSLNLEVFIVMLVYFLDGFLLLVMEFGFLIVL